VALTGVVDGTGDFMNVGEVSLSFTLPTDWAKNVVNDQGPFYFIRLRVTTADASPTIQPLANRISIGLESVTGTITNPTAVSGDANFGEFTASIPDGTFDLPGTYIFRAKLATASGLFYGKSIAHEVKDDFAQ